MQPRICRRRPRRVIHRRELIHRAGPEGCLLPEIDDLAALDDAALVDAAAGWAQTQNAACARKTAVMAELFTRRTGLPRRGARAVVG